MGPGRSVVGRRIARRLVPWLAVLLLGVGAFALVRRLGRAELVAEQDLPADVQVEVDLTWDRFTTVFDKHRNCYDDVSLLLVGDLEQGDARYVIDEARIEIRIPTSPRRFRESLAHELAHHLEHTCGRFTDLEDDFRALPGVDATAWSTADRWQDTPAELWAETVVAIVNGERVRHERSMPLPPGAIELVENWADTGS